MLNIALTWFLNSYTYEVCLFDEARQKPNKGGTTFSLGYLFIFFPLRTSLTSIQALRILERCPWCQTWWPGVLHQATLSKWSKMLEWPYAKCGCECRIILSLLQPDSMHLLARHGMWHRKRYSLRRRIGEVWISVHRDEPCTLPTPWRGTCPGGAKRGFVDLTAHNLMEFLLSAIPWSWHRLKQANAQMILQGRLSLYCTAFFRPM